jgi:predicted O-methyltransferase YrrM
VLDRARTLRREMRFLAELRLLPPRVALFQWRAWRLASRLGDSFSPVSRTEARKLAVLLNAARGRRRVVELGTGTAWTTISLVLADPGREVLSYDPIERPERDRYLRLVSAETRRRLKFVGASGDDGPLDSELVDLLYIDSSHHREDTISEVEAWRPALGQGSLVVFDDFAHSDYPGVEEAVRYLGLVGDQRHGLFIHRVGS